MGFSLDSFVPNLKNRGIRPFTLEVGGDIVLYPDQRMEVIPAFRKTILGAVGEGVYGHMVERIFDNNPQRALRLLKGHRLLASFHAHLSRIDPDVLSSVDVRIMLEKQRAFARAIPEMVTTDEGIYVYIPLEGKDLQECSGQLSQLEEEPLDIRLYAWKARGIIQQYFSLYLIPSTRSAQGKTPAQGIPSVASAVEVGEGKERWVTRSPGGAGKQVLRNSTAGSATEVNGAGRWLSCIRSILRRPSRDELVELLQRDILSGHRAPENLAKIRRKLKALKIKMWIIRKYNPRRSDQELISPIEFLGHNYQDILTRVERHAVAGLCPDVHRALAGILTHSDFDSDEDSAIVLEVTGNPVRKITILHSQRQKILKEIFDARASRDFVRRYVKWVLLNMRYPHYLAAIGRYAQLSYINAGGTALLVTADPHRRVYGVIPTILNFSDNTARGTQSTVTKTILHFPAGTRQSSSTVENNRTTDAKRFLAPNELAVSNAIATAWTLTSHDGALHQRLFDSFSFDIRAGPNSVLDVSRQTLILKEDIFSVPSVDGLTNRLVELIILLASRSLNRPEYEAADFAELCVRHPHNIISQLKENPSMIPLALKAPQWEARCCGIHALVMSQAREAASLLFDLFAREKHPLVIFGSMLGIIDLRLQAVEMLDMVMSKYDELPEGAEIVISEGLQDWVFLMGVEWEDDIQRLSRVLLRLYEFCIGRPELGVLNKLTISKLIDIYLLRDDLSDELARQVGMVVLNVISHPSEDDIESAASAVGMGEGNGRDTRTQVTRSQVQKNAAGSAIEGNGSNSSARIQEREKFGRRKMRMPKVQTPAVAWFLVGEERHARSSSPVNEVPSRERDSVRVAGENSASIVQEFGMSEIFLEAERRHFTDTGMILEKFRRLVRDMERSGNTAGFVMRYPNFYCGQSFFIMWERGREKMYKSIRDFLWAPRHPFRDILGTYRQAVFTAVALENVYVHVPGGAAFVMVRRTPEFAWIGIADNGHGVRDRTGAWASLSRALRWRKSTGWGGHGEGLKKMTGRYADLSILRHPREEYIVTPGIDIRIPALMAMGERWINVYCRPRILARRAYRPDVGFSVQGYFWEKADRVWQRNLTRDIINGVARNSSAVLCKSSNTKTSGRPEVFLRARSPQGRTSPNFNPRTNSAGSAATVGGMRRNSAGLQVASGRFQIGRSSVFEALHKSFQDHAAKRASLFAPGPFIQIVSGREHDVPEPFRGCLGTHGVHFDSHISWRMPPLERFVGIVRGGLKVEHRDTIHVGNGGWLGYYTSSDITDQYAVVVPLTRFFKRGYRYRMEFTTMDPMTFPANPHQYCRSGQLGGRELMVWGKRRDWEEKQPIIGPSDLIYLVHAQSIAKVEKALVDSYTKDGAADVAGQVEHFHNRTLLYDFPGWDGWDQLNLATGWLVHTAMGMQKFTEMTGGLELHKNAEQLDRRVLEPRFMDEIFQGWDDGAQDINRKSVDYNDADGRSASAVRCKSKNANGPEGPEVAPWGTSPVPTCKPATPRTNSTGSAIEGRNPYSSSATLLDRESAMHHDSSAASAIENNGEKRNALKFSVGDILKGSEYLQHEGARAVAVLSGEAAPHGFWKDLNPRVILYIMHLVSEETGVYIKCFTSVEFCQKLKLFNGKSLKSLLVWYQRYSKSKTQREAVVALLSGYLNIDLTIHDYEIEEVYRSRKFPRDAWGDISAQGKRHMVEMLARARNKPVLALSADDFRAVRAEFGGKSLYTLLYWAMKEFKTRSHGTACSRLLTHLFKHENRYDQDLNCSLSASYVSRIRGDKPTAQSQRSTVIDAFRRNWRSVRLHEKAPGLQGYIVSTKSDRNGNISLEGKWLQSRLFPHAQVELIVIRGIKRFVRFITDEDGNPIQDVYDKPLVVEVFDAEGRACDVRKQINRNAKLSLVRYLNGFNLMHQKRDRESFMYAWSRAKERLGFLYPRLKNNERDIALFVARAVGPRSLSHYLKQACSQRETVVDILLRFYTREREHFKIEIKRILWMAKKSAGTDPHTRSFGVELNYYLGELNRLYGDELFVDLFGNGEKRLEQILTRVISEYEHERRLSPLTTYQIPAFNYPLPR